MIKMGTHRLRGAFFFIETMLRDSRQKKHYDTLVLARIPRLTDPMNTMGISVVTHLIHVCLQEP